MGGLLQLAVGDTDGERLARHKSPAKVKVEGGACKGVWSNVYIEGSRRFAHSAYKKNEVPIPLPHP